MEMEYRQNTIQNFCRQVSESYSFDNKVSGLDDLTNGAVVAPVSQSDLADSGRFKRSELAARLAEEPTKCMTLGMDTTDLSTSHVLTQEGFAYSTSHPPKSVEGSYIFKPAKRKLSQEELRMLLRAA